MVSAQSSSEVIEQKLPGPLPYELEREMPGRVVVIGDLNAQFTILQRFLIGMKLMKKNGAWCGGRTVLVQMGDIPNRGSASRASMELMIRLRPEALAAGGDVLWLLGNHEVMSVLGHEAYVTADEYLEFATQEEVDRFFVERTRYMYEMLGAPDVAAYINPLGGRIKAWEDQHAPGKAAYRYAMSADGYYGRYVRNLPIAFKFGKLLFIHGGLSPNWAQLGLEGLQTQSQQTWAKRPRFYQELDPNGIFRDPLGPLWHRAYCVANAKLVRRDLTEALAAMDASQMIVGHTRTDSVENGRVSFPLIRQRGRLIMSDVGLGDPGEAGCALILEKGKIEAWSPGGAKSRVGQLKAR